ncbi:hypothetical protein [Streptomyces aurantiacus]|uniref:hypothetical protein n=1 Tax=Streptomyces aurantiacus TaxID=47760 RepID=UPI0006E3A9E8|nr:hypothetical protein [Streptomyces aurantiacus]
MLKRSVVTFGLSIAVVVAGAAVAMAGDEWGSAECSQNPLPGCELGAGSGGHDPAPRPDAGGPSSGSGSSGGSGSSRGGQEQPKSEDPDLNLADCSYRRSSYQSPPTAVQAAYGDRPGGGAVVVQVPAYFSTAQGSTVPVPVADPQPGEAGAWYVYKCTAGGVRDALYRPPVWIPDGPEQDAERQPTPGQLAQTARDQLQLPSLRIETNPAGDQLVDLPTWLWLDRSQWEAVSATASVPGVSVTAVARPTSVVWTMGDGSSVTCDGPGTPYGTAGPGTSAPGSPRSASPDCGHTYRLSSAGQPDGAYPVSATVHWTATWTGAGQSGVFPGLTTTSTAAFRVEESQALNNGG